MTLLVSGEIALPQATASFSGATLYVSLESIGMMDMPSKVIAQSTVNNLSYSGSNLSFELKGAVGEDAESLTVRAHISMHGSDDVQKGDYLTKRSYSVQREKLPETLTLQVELV